MANDTIKSSWREQRVFIRGGDSETVYFNDTTPNYVQLSNSNSSPIYVGTNANVDAQSYDLVVPSLGTRIMQSMHPYNSIQLFNSGLDDTYVSIKSWMGEFNPSAIAQSTELVGVGQNGILGVVDVNMLLGSLPSGSNLIGGVSIMNHLVSLPTGDNVIGRVDIQSLPNHAAKKVKISGDANQEKTVKLTGGVVYQMQTDLEDATLYDGSVQAWASGSFKSSVGAKFDADIRVRFVTSGDVFILYH